MRDEPQRQCRRQVTYGYGPAGEVSATDANGGTTQYFFDARGLLVKVTDPLGNATHYAYDSNFNLTQVIDAAGQVTSYSYDQNGNLIKTTGPDGQTVAYTYAGPFNRLTSYTDPDGNTHQLRLRQPGQSAGDHLCQRHRGSIQLRPVGNLTQTINARGQAIHDTYNSMGQLTQEDLRRRHLLRLRLRYPRQLDLRDRRHQHHHIPVRPDRGTCSRSTTPAAAS